jgi:hypothetical protein
LIQGIGRIVHPSFLSVFEPHELEMMLNGPQFIDVKDWRQNTVYKDYTATDDVIQWFWKTVEQYDQKQLGNLLHYCTGSNSVPILGFKYL